MTAYHHGADGDAIRWVAEDGNDMFEPMDDGMIAIPKLRRLLALAAVVPAGMSRSAGNGQPGAGFLLQ